MTMQVKPVTARAVRCGELWVLEIPSLSMRVPSNDLEDTDAVVTTALTRRRPHVKWVVRVHITTYLHVDDLAEGRRRSILGAARKAPPARSDDKSA